MKLVPTGLVVAAKLLLPNKAATADPKVDMGSNSQEAMASSSNQEATASSNKEVMDSSKAGTELSREAMDSSKVDTVNPLSKATVSRVVNTVDTSRVALRRLHLLATDDDEGSSAVCC